MNTEWQYPTFLFSHFYIVFTDIVLLEYLDLRTSPPPGR